MDANSITSLEKFIVTHHGKLDILVRNRAFCEEHFFTHFSSARGKKGKKILGIWEFEISMIPHLQGFENFIPQ